MNALEKWVVIGNIHSRYLMYTCVMHIVYGILVKSSLVFFCLILFVRGPWFEHVSFSFSSGRPDVPRDQLDFRATLRGVVTYIYLR